MFILDKVKVNAYSKILIMYLKLFSLFVSVILLEQNFISPLMFDANHNILFEKSFPLLVGMWYYFIHGYMYFLSYITLEQNSSTPNHPKGLHSYRNRDCCLIPWIPERWSPSWRRIPDWIKPWLESMWPRKPTAKSWRLL